MYVIRVFVKSTNELRWTEKHPTKERMLTELQHMKETHFNPQCFNFEVSEIQE